VPERDVRGLLGSFGFGGDAVNKPSGVLSGGEKIRLAFARIFINPPNFLLLDEPTTNLDIHGREALEKAIREYKGTVCFVSHDVAFVRGAADHIISIGSNGVVSYPGGYDYYLEKLETGNLNRARGELGTANAGQRSGKPEIGKPEIRNEAVQVSSLNPKDLRIARAKEREVQKELRKMEEGMEKLQVEQQALNEKMASGDLSLNYGALNIQLAEVTKKLNALEAKWLEEAERLGS
jgi:ATP-binding cassette subfamily F protein 3